jgi:prevent-host-death family protein
MKTASITEAKNGLSSLIDRVRAGESVLITDRGIPVARIEPVAAGDDPTGRLERLERAGLIRRGTGPISLDQLQPPPPKLPEGVSAIDAVLEERRSGW